MKDLDNVNLSFRLILFFVKMQNLMSYIVIYYRIDILTSQQESLIFPGHFPLNFRPQLCPHGVGIR